MACGMPGNRGLPDVQPHAPPAPRQDAPGISLTIGGTADAVRQAFGGKTLLDFGLGIEPGRFGFHDTWCVAPTSLVLAYALAVATSGQAARILLAGFDGYAPGDARNDEIEAMLSAFATSGGIRHVMSVTPTRYRGLNTCSIHGL